MGLICLYSLKNTTHPEYAYSCEAGVCCLDFHPESAALLAVGLYDGKMIIIISRNGPGVRYKKQAQETYLLVHCSYSEAYRPSVVGEMEPRHL